MKTHNGILPIGKCNLAACRVQLLKPIKFITKSCVPDYAGKGYIEFSIPATNGVLVYKVLLLRFTLMDDNELFASSKWGTRAMPLATVLFGEWFRFGKPSDQNDPQQLPRGIPPDIPKIPPTDGFELLTK
ncbi:hypothetical protein LXL04_039660 [Taraxacum kok-saghyz]